MILLKRITEDKTNKSNIVGNGNGFKIRIYEDNGKVKVKVTFLIWSVVLEGVKRENRNGFKIRGHKVNNQIVIKVSFCWLSVTFRGYLANLKISPDELLKIIK